jgi:aromatic ring-opening dioxygenase catalytic subunit (LigB family)
MLPILYLPHGAGPLPLFDEPSQSELTAFLKNIPTKLGNPKAILVISAHWEETQPSITGASEPSLIYDYYGFGEKSYEIEYKAKGSPSLAKRVQELLHVKGLKSVIDEKRGYDHGMFVPLKLMYPKADIPIIQLSLSNSLSPLLHIQMGEALRKLKEEGVLIVGSGLSFHNMRAYGSPSIQGEKFDKWLQETLQSGDYESTKKKLVEWDKAPEARYAHPREEHLLPLHVCFGASTQSAEVVFDSIFMSTKVSGFLWR